VNNEQELVVEESRGFSTEDILWSVGIWSVILCLSPVILFYMMMVA
jgi:lipopolysaccharide export LptBFGC system permease protein LptF